MSMEKNYINGLWVGSAESTSNINPSNTDDVVGQFARADAGAVEQAVASARDAAPRWAGSTPQERFDVLDAVGTEILARKEELGHLLAREEGKILSEAIGEVTRAGHIFKFFAGEALRIAGEHMRSVRPDVEIDILRHPLGVVALITPWNYPIAIPAWKIAPALAYGNAVVFKPAELAPACSWQLSDMLSRTALPPGTFNLVMGRGSLVGELLVDHPAIDGISFTGSVETGRRIAARAARRMARVQLEMGGKNPLVILDDADLDLAVSAALNGAYFSTGQRCTASSRLIATAGIHDRFVQKLTERLRQLKVDDALEPGTEMGPVVDEAQLTKNLTYIDIAQAEGGRLAYGGTRLQRKHPGYYMAPALITETDNAMRINREEVFGPVASVLRAKDYDEALALANDTPFGLSSGICTQSLAQALHFREHARAGMVMVNLPTAGVDDHVPFGGSKDSSFGPKEQGRYAVEFFTSVTTCYTKP
jgi:acyl-CoA reductase-like NAD-dependent aldehyde dehydrogenase